MYCQDSFYCSWPILNAVLRIPYPFPYTSWTCWQNCGGWTNRLVFLLTIITIRGGFILVKNGFEQGSWFVTYEIVILNILVPQLMRFVIVTEVISRLLVTWYLLYSNYLWYALNKMLLSILNSNSNLKDRFIVVLLDSKGKVFIYKYYYYLIYIFAVHLLDDRWFPRVSFATESVGTHQW